MSWKDFAWDGLTRLLAKAHTWTGVQTFASLVATTADINAGTVDATIGGTTPAAGEFLDIGVTDQINLKDGTATHIIKAVQEDGLGGRLTLGLDETARTMVICDAGNIDTDLGLSAQGEPSLYIMSGSGASSVKILRGGIYTTGSFQFDVGNVEFRMNIGSASGNIFKFIPVAGQRLTDADGEQSWMYLNPDIYQSGTAAYNGLKIKVTETGLGNGSTGEGAPGNNLILAGTSTDPDMFKVDNVGRIVLAESSDPAALADHAFLYAKDVAGTGEMFAADAAAAATQLTSHNFTMFEPDPNEKFPWSFYAENKALGAKINVDMARMVRAVEALTGQTFIHYADIEKSIDLETAYKAQWEREYIQKNTYEKGVSKDQAFEMVEEDERVLYDIEVVDPKTGKTKIVKRGKKIGEKSMGFELVDGEVKEKIEPIWETKKVQKPQLKEDCRFDETDGKFYENVVPTKAMAKAAAIEGFEFILPAWMVEKLKAVKTPK